MRRCHHPCLQIGAKLALCPLLQAEVWEELFATEAVAVAETAVLLLDDEMFVNAFEPLTPPNTPILLSNASICCNL